MKSHEPRRIDVPEVIEVFVDQLRFLTFDGHQLRMEFDVVRKDGAAPEDESRHWTYTASRLVMSAHGVPAMLDQMARLQAAIAPRAAAAAPEPEHEVEAAEPVLKWKGRETVRG
ncbi:hypothetical protein [Phenylobacterium sp.]|uniref:hypothetical protein n=1 Tax=Phenylobacterium sp. TaxID=1871053 RepID=UPI0035678A90